MTSLPFEPFPYQREAAELFVRSVMRKKSTRALVVLPTGCGKTKTSYLIAFGISRRTLFLAHTDQLVSQPAKDLRRDFPDIRVGIVKASTNDNTAAFVIASVQTLAKDDRLKDLLATQSGFGAFDLVIVDEAHHAIEGSTYEKIVNALPEVPVLGLTATPERTDKKPIGKLFCDGIVYRMTPREAMDARGPGPFIVPISDGRGNIHESRRILVPDADMRAVAKAADAGGKDAEKAALLEAIVEATVAGIFLAKDAGRRSVCFTMSVASSDEIARRAGERGIRCASVHGKKKAREINALLKAHAEGNLDALVNCNILLEGYDDPGVDGIVWGRPTESRPLYVQGVGRGLRLDRKRPFGSPGGKNDCALFDLVGAHDAHGIQTGETLFTEEHVGAAGADEEAPDGDEKPEEQEEDRETLLYRSFLACLAGKRVLNSATRGRRAGWLEVYDGQAYAMSGSDGKTYLIERSGSGWVCYAEPKKGYAWQLTPEGVDFEAAQIAAEENGAFSGLKTLTDRKAPWRGKEASQKMMEALEKWRIPAPPGITMAQATDAITIAIARSRMGSRDRRGTLKTGGALL